MALLLSACGPVLPSRVCACLSVRLLSWCAVLGLAKCVLLLGAGGTCHSSIMCVLLLPPGQGLLLLLAIVCLTHKSCCQVQAGVGQQTHKAGLKKVKALFHNLPSIVVMTQCAVGVR